MTTYLITEAQHKLLIEALGTHPDFDTEDLNSEAVGVLQSLPMVDSKPVAHMYPWDLERFATNETTGHAYSVAVGCPDGKSVPLYTSPQALTPITADRITELEAQLSHLSEVASIKHDFENICEYNIGCGFTPESLRVWLAQNKEKLYTSPQALTPITADDVTNEMINDCMPQWMMTELEDVREIFVQIYNAVIKHRSFLK